MVVLCGREYLESELITESWFWLASKLGFKPGKLSKIYLEYVLDIGKKNWRITFHQELMNSQVLEIFLNVIKIWLE